MARISTRCSCSVDHQHTGVPHWRKPFICSTWYFRLSLYCSSCLNESEPTIGIGSQDREAADHKVNVKLDKTLNSFHTKIDALYEQLAKQQRLRKSRATPGNSNVCCYYSMSGSMNSSKWICPHSTSSRMTSSPRNFTAQSLDVRQINWGNNVLECISR